MGVARGSKSKGNAPCIVVHCNLCPCIYIECLKCLNDTSCVYVIIIIGMNVVDNLNSVQVTNKPCV